MNYRRFVNWWLRTYICLPHSIPLETRSAIAASAMNRLKQHTCRHLLVILLLFPGVLAVLCGQSAKVLAFATSPEVDYQYFDLNCNVDSWEGYFAPARWQHSVSKEMDEATNSKAPGPAYADGSGTVVIGQHPEAMEEWSIEIPVAGYLSFRLMPAENARRQELSVVINDREQIFKLRSDGLYYSPYLRTGDRFILRIPAGTTVYQWTKLLFHTNFSAVIVRPGETAAADRYVAVEADLIQRVVFSDNGPGAWPVFDRDGDLTTLDDQTELRSSDERFHVEYIDEILQHEGDFFLQRTFIIRENCSRGNWLRTSRRWVDLPIIAE